MFIAHLPAGYLLSKIHPVLGKRTQWVMLGAILPDIDLAVFYLIDGRAVHHHNYLTHRPVLWLCIGLLGVLFSKYENSRLLVAIGVGGLSHMSLDTVAGAIVWAWPFSQVARPWVVVPATHDLWVMSFLVHWTFAIEILICAGAALIWARTRIRSAIG